MEIYLYKDLYTLEDQHWWHRAKRQLVIEAIQKFSPLGVSTRKKLPTQTKKILDIGCGTGKNLEVFAQFGTVYGVDVSPEALKFCKKRKLHHVKIADVEQKLPFPSKYFDVVTLLDVLEHIEEDPALKEISRVLKPGGILLVTVPAFQWLWSNWDVILHHKRRYTQTTLKKVLKKMVFEFVFLHMSIPF